MYLFVLNLFIFAVTVAAVNGDFVCQEGEYLHSNEKEESSCIPCPPGTFMDQPNHRNLECALCSVAESFSHEVVLQPCNKTVDAVIGCNEEYFRAKRSGDVMKDGECYRCKDCKYFHMREVKPCSMFEDTICSGKLFSI